MSEFANRLINLELDIKNDWCKKNVDKILYLSEDIIQFFRNNIQYTSQGALKELPPNYRDTIQTLRQCIDYLNNLIPDKSIKIIKATTATPQYPIVVPFSPLVKLLNINKIELETAKKKINLAKRQKPSPTLDKCRRLSEDVRIHQKKWLDTCDLIQKYSSLPFKMINLEDLAQNIAYWDQYLFQAVDPYNPTTLTPCFHFQTFITTILTHCLLLGGYENDPTVHHVAKIINDYLRLANILLVNFNNFNGYCAVIRVLTSPQVSCLTSVWKLLTRPQIDQYETLKKLISRENHYQAYFTKFLTKLKNQKEGTFLIPWMEPHYYQIHSTDQVNHSNSVDLLQSLKNSSSCVSQTMEISHWILTRPYLTNHQLWALAKSIQPDVEIQPTSTPFSHVEIQPPSKSVKQPLEEKSQSMDDSILAFIEETSKDEINEEEQGLLSYMDFEDVHNDSNHSRSPSLTSSKLESSTKSHSKSSSRQIDFNNISLGDADHSHIDYNDMSDLPILPSSPGSSHFPVSQTDISDIEDVHYLSNSAKLRHKRYYLGRSDSQSIHSDDGGQRVGLLDLEQTDHEQSSFKEDDESDTEEDEQDSEEEDDENDHVEKFPPAWWTLPPIPITPPHTFDTSSLASGASKLSKNPFEDPSPTDHTTLPIAKSSSSPNISQTELQDLPPRANSVSPKMFFFESLEGQNDSTTPIESLHKEQNQSLETKIPDSYENRGFANNISNQSISNTDNFNNNGTMKDSNISDNKSDEVDDVLASIKIDQIQTTTNGSLKDASEAVPVTDKESSEIKPKSTMNTLSKLKKRPLAPQNQNGKSNHDSTSQSTNTINLTKSTVKSDPLQETTQSNGEISVMIENNQSDDSSVVGDPLATPVPATSKLNLLRKRPIPPPTSRLSGK